jgi:hypothetical protein
MVRLLYLRELVPLLDAKPDPAVTPGEARAGRTEDESNATEIARGGGFVYALSTTPVPEVQARPEGETEAAMRPATGRTDPPDVKFTESERRAEFIYDMTFMPLPTVVETLETGGEDYWRKKLESAERLVGVPRYKMFLHLMRVFRYWKTLRYSLECLKDDEFRERLAASEVGKDLKTKKAWTQRGLAGWDELVVHLLKRFQAIGGASSENFARHSRGWCVAVGFLLAIFLNVDSLDLLNSYLTDPTLRQQVIARADTIQAQQVSAPQPAETSALAPARARLEAAATELTSAAQGLTGGIEALTSKLGSAEGDLLAQSVKSELQSATAQFKGLQDGLEDLDQDVTAAQATIRGVAQSLTTSFPIGWTRFPNCRTADSPDIRCQGKASDIPSGSSWSSTLAAARSNHPEAFLQWVVGVLLTGLLLGLGTPFWVQAVSAAFSLRRWDAKTDEKGNEQTGSSGGAARPPMQQVGATGAGTAGAVGAGSPVAT